MAQIATLGAEFCLDYTAPRFSHLMALESGQTGFFRKQNRFCPIILLVFISILCRMNFAFSYI